MIKRVVFENFKQFSSFDKPLRPTGTTIVAGGNNSGKSSLLHGLAVWEFAKLFIELEKGRNALNNNYNGDGIGISFDETTDAKLESDLAEVFGIQIGESVSGIPDTLKRNSEFLTHPIFNTLHNGTIPSDVPLVPLMMVPFDLMLDSEIPIPPAYFEIFADSLIMCIMLSKLSSIDNKKQLESCDLLVPELNKVGVA